MFNIAVAQSGGPTAAINASLTGVFNGAEQEKEVDEIYGAENGIEGILGDRLLNLRSILMNDHDKQLLMTTPSTILGSCRFKLKDESDYLRITEVFNRHNIRAFFYIGGNDSMDTVMKLNSYFVAKDIRIKVVGVPKTIDNDVTEHAMPGGATSSSQEGALKQGYIHLLPYMLKFLAGTRKIVRYHDVTPGSQITWNTAFLAVTGAYKRGGEEEVKYLLGVLERVNDVPDEAELSEGTRAARLALYQDCNDAFRNLLLGKFGKLPLGFPPDWVYESAFGNAWKQAIADRTTHSPLEKLTDMDIEAERKAFRDIIKREPTEEEMVMYLNHPGDAVKTVQFRAKYGDPNRLPLPVWFEGCSVGEEINFVDTSGKPHQFLLVSMSPANDAGESMVRFVLDSEIFSQLIKVAPPKNGGAGGAVMADPADKYQVGAPSNGDLWVMYVHPGDIVEEGEELFNVSIMKQEKAVLAPVAGIVKRVLKTADYKETRKMETVREGELIVELGPVPRICTNEACSRPLPMNDIEFCPYCGERLSRI